MTAKFDKSKILKDAHRRYRQGKRLGLGWSFGQCLSTAWAAARIARDNGSTKYARAA